MVQSEKKEVRKMKISWFWIYGLTVLMCGISFICYLLNQLHLDLKEIKSSSETRTLKRNIIKERQGTIFSIIIILAVILFIILSYIHLKKPMTSQ